MLYNRFDEIEVAANNRVIASKARIRLIAVLILGAFASVCFPISCILATRSAKVNGRPLLSPQLVMS